MKTKEKTEAAIKFGRRIAELRQAAELSQEALAEICNFNRTYIGSIERAEKAPTINTIDRLAKGLKISLTDLFNYQ